MSSHRILSTLALMALLAILGAQSALSDPQEGKSIDVPVKMRY